MEPVDHHSRLIVALQPRGRPPVEQLDFVKRWDVQTVSVGLGLFVEFGPDIFKEIAARQLRVMLDLKLHDNADQLSWAVAAAVRHGASIITVNTGAGLSALRAAVEAVKYVADELRQERALVIGSTVLTGQSNAMLLARGFEKSTTRQVLRMAEVARMAGLDGIECSPLEIQPIQDVLNQDLLLVVSGVSISGQPRHDHRRVGDPNRAIKAGATHLHVGRDIWQATNPDQRASDYLVQMNDAFRWLATAKSRDSV